MVEAGGWEPRCWVGSIVLVEGTGAMSVEGTVVGLEAGVEVVVILDGTFWCLLKVFQWSVLLIFSACLFRLLRYP